MRSNKSTSDMEQPKATCVPGYAQETRGADIMVLFIYILGKLAAVLPLTNTLFFSYLLALKKIQCTILYCKKMFGCLCFYV